MAGKPTGRVTSVHARKILSHSNPCGPVLRDPGRSASLRTVEGYGAPAQGQAPTSVLLTEDSVKHVSDHVYVLMGFPNIGIVVGERATLVVDTGMGTRNGAVVVRAVSKLAKTANLYLTTTHFHPEHASGEGAFSANTVLIRPVTQQQELEAHAMEYVDLFRSRSAPNKELLADVKFRTRTSHSTKKSPSIWAA